MDVREAVKDKGKYKDIAEYFRKSDTLDTDQLTLLIDTIELMSEEVFEHYKALQAIFKESVSDILKRREREGGQFRIPERFSEGSAFICSPKGRKP